MPYMEKWEEENKPNTYLDTERIQVGHSQPKAVLSDIYLFRQCRRKGAVSVKPAASSPPDYASARVQGF